MNRKERKVQLLTHMKKQSNSEISLDIKPEIFSTDRKILLPDKMAILTRDKTPLL